MKRFTRQTWWLIASLFLFLPWLAPTAYAEVYGSTDHDYTIEITPTITGNSITLDYKVNIPDGKTVNNGYSVRAWLVGATSGNDSETLTTQTGKLVLSNLNANTKYTIFAVAYIYTGTEEGTRLISLEGDKALRFSTTGGSGTVTDVTYKAVLGASIIGTNTITVPYQFYMVKNGQDIAINDDNKGDLQFKAFFAWAGNDSEQEAKALTSFNGAYVCEGLNPATAYDLYPKFFVNGIQVAPKGSFKLTTLSEEKPAEKTYTNYVQQMLPSGDGPTDDDPIALTWNNATSRYEFKVTKGNIYSVVAKPTDSSGDKVFGSAPNWPACAIQGTTETTELTETNHWDIEMTIDGTFYVYTKNNVKDGLPTHYGFLADSDIIPEGDYINKAREMKAEGETTDNFTDLEWDKYAKRYAFAVTSDKLYAIVAVDKTTGNIVESYGTAKNIDASLIKANVGRTDLHAGADRWDFNFQTDGTLYIYTTDDIKGNLPVAYEFLTKADASKLITMADLHAVNSMSGIIMGGVLDENGDAVFTVPDYAKDIEGAMGMSGHYARADKKYSVKDADGNYIFDGPEYEAERTHWLPKCYYEIGNDEAGHIVGYVDYPTPMPNGGFELNIRLNTNIWFKFQEHTGGSYEKDGITYNRYYFSTEYFKTDRFNPEPVNNIEPLSEDIAYVDGTVSFLFRTPMAAGGTNQTRSFTYEVKGSKRTTPAITVQDYANRYLDADAVYYSYIEPLGEHEEGYQGDWGHVAHPQDFATVAKDGVAGVEYEDTPIYWHPGINFAIGNNTEQATGDGSQLALVAKLDDGTTIPTDIEAFFDVYELDANGNKLSDAPVATGRLQSVPDEINLFFAKTTDKYKVDPTKKLGVVFRYQYTSIRPANGWSETALRTYTVSETPEITAIEGVAAEGNDAEAPVEYYNLQGMKVANPAGGIFIRRQGNTVTKVLVK